MEISIMKPKTGCLVCGAALVYMENRMTLACAICGEEKLADARCENDHFICDACHSVGPGDWIEHQCLQSDATDPVQLAIQIMRHPKVAMHGPEHHFLVPAVLLATFYQLSGQGDIKAGKIQEARRRAKTVVGGSCGFHGACGAAIGVGIFVSLVTEATPLSKTAYRLCNSATAQALSRIAEQGGPRCCKRNVVLALKCAAEFSRANLGQPLPIASFQCDFFPGNRECLGSGCGFFPEKKNRKSKNRPPRKA